MSHFLGYCLFFLACADTPVADAPGSPKGKILILENQRVLEGDIDRIGDQYRVRRGMGEVLLPASAGMKLCESWDEAYQFMRSRANLGDPEERLRLARWCQLNGLRPQALAEVAAALEMRVDYPEAKQLQALLARPSAPATPVSLVKSPTKPKPSEPGVDLSAETLAYYNSKVQPILMNACAHCHTAGRGGAFQIHRSNEAGGQRAALQKTLASIVAYINMDAPAQSPLLVKAVSVHFPKGAAPLSGRQSPAFKTLERWVLGVPEHNPHLRGSGLASTVELIPTPPQRSLLKKAPAAPPPAVRQIMPPEPVKPKIEPKQSTKVTVPDFVSSGLSPPAATVVPVSAPAELPTDPFDPIIFNRQAHPKK